ncbi:MAG: hypothetical protein HYV07_23860 [Deltaproteobacteria bacterium]|nr:hypothetical protein [Deltaproteobacteria bacterium]
MSLFFLLVPLAALEVEAHVELEKGKLPIVGEPFKLVVEAAHEKGEIALLPEKLDLGESIGERPAARKHDRSERGGKEIDRYDLELLAFDAGALEIPPIPLAIGSTTASSKAITIEVQSGLRPDEQLVAGSTRPEALSELEKMSAANPAPLAITVRDYTLLFAGLGLLAAIAIAYLVVRYRKKKVESLSEVPAAPPRPAHELALERLEALASSSTLGRGELKPFFVELSEILRVYVGGRYGFESVELTVRELVDELNTRGAEGLDLEALQKLLDNADLVKFAKWESTTEDARASLALAFGLVKKSRPREDLP